MAIQPFLAISGAEMGEKTAFSFPVAWLACQFSSYGRGLSNLPSAMPEGSLLILTDQTPIRGHDEKMVLQQLTYCLDAFGCRGILLDFQRPGHPEAEAMVQALVQALPCPVAVSAAYAQKWNCPIFLPPVPPSVPLQDYLASWQGQELWLELALDGEILTVTEEGTTVTPQPFGETGENGFRDQKLHCHYRMMWKDGAAEFTLWRTREDLDMLLADAGSLGVTNAVGLYQELRK